MNFPVHSAETAPDGARGPLGQIAQRYGFVPNLAGVFAESPATLQILIGALGAYDDPAMTLTPVERQVVLLTVSALNRCEYCTAAHGMVANMAGLDRADVERLQQRLPIDDARLEALRRFVKIMVERSGWASDQDVEAFLTAGYTKAQVLEVIAGIALKTLTNYANHVAKPPVNAEFASFLPKWADAA